MLEISKEISTIKSVVSYKLIDSVGRSSQPSLSVTLSGEDWQSDVVKIKELVKNNNISYYSISIIK
jgi:rRNA processing protein Krr1/Pno1